MTQRDRDVLKVMSGVLKGDRTQVEAARLLGKSERQVRRIADRLRKRGDGAVVHGLRGRPSNRRLDEQMKRSALSLYKHKYADFGPTLAAEKLAEADQVVVAIRTLREWLLSEGLWHRKRERDVHRSRRERRPCFGELVQADASLHDWLEGRGDRMVLVGMIDDASSRVLARFHPAETSEAYMEVLGRWVKKHGRPVAWYSDRHGIFRAEDAFDDPVQTQFSRALSELDIALICANSPQAKGRVERLWGTAQDRLVKELRLANARTLTEANQVLESKFLPWFNRRCVVKPVSGNDAHRALSKGHDLAAILSHQTQRVVANDYTIRFENEVYQLLPPAWPGERGGKVIVQQRLDGSMKVRFKQRYLEFRRIEKRKEEDGKTMGAPPPNPRSLPHEPIPAAAQAKGRVDESTRPSAVHRTPGRSGRTPAEPCPPGGGSSGRGKNAYRPPPNHPWRKTG